MPDRGFRHEMARLNVACPDCDWKGQLKDYQVRFHTTERRGMHKTYYLRNDGISNRTLMK